MTLKHLAHACWDAQLQIDSFTENLQRVCIAANMSADSVCIIVALVNNVLHKKGQ